MPSKKNSTGSKSAAGKKAAGKRAAKSRGGRPLAVMVPVAGGVVATPPARQDAVENERVNFARLVAANPNHFGNMPGTGFKPAFQMSGNDRYEELTCVGFNPRLDSLEATVKIKQPSGYGGGPCGRGTFEYVRFYINYGRAWEDLGLAAFNAHDIPNTVSCARLADKPHSHVVSLRFEPRRECCRTPVLPKVRAILSWNQPPPPNSPNWNPVWGQVKDRTIQIRPGACSIFDFITTLDLGVVNFDIVSVLEKLPEIKLMKETPIPPQPDPPPLAALAKMYGFAPGKRAAPAVEPHRFAMTRAQQAVNFVTAEATLVKSNFEEFTAVGLDLSAVLGALNVTSNNPTYEQIDCVGLDNNNDWLVGTFTVKKPFGYSGGLCQQGSKEYVAFWADWDDSCKWEYQGTVAVDVHDIPGIPLDGLRYSAILPVPLGQYRRPCNRPRISRVRAVLSWNSPPSTTDPDALPHWGNRVDAHVRIRPGDPTPTDRPVIHKIGDVPVGGIDIATTGLTNSLATYGTGGYSVDLLGRPCPFGGIIKIAADVPPEFSGLGYKYRVVVRLAGGGGTEFPVLTPFETYVFGNSTPTIQTPNASGYVNYLPHGQNFERLLGKWNSTAYGSPDALWEVRVEMVDAAFTPIGETAWHRIQLDNTAPEAEITIDLETAPGSGVLIGAGECKDFTVGDLVKGHFVATDLYFGSYGIQVTPASLTPPPTSPSGGNSPTPPFPGSTWELDTEDDVNNMEPCGYVVTLRVYDRSIVNSTPGHHNSDWDDEGFCLRAKGSK